jgi:NAD(P)-dependent dehydrogenase (short-subunit alcohol dehydrogenase family)
MGNRLKGRRILVTGAASGMGRGIAELFAAEGAALALCDRNATGVAEAAAAFGAHGYACDVSLKADVQQTVGRAIEALGGLDGIVNAAGILHMQPFAELESAALEKMLGVNLLGPFNVIQSGLQALQQAERATVVNVASVSAFLPMAGSSGYSASKAGLTMLTKCLALELGPRIRCNTICPGVIKTEMTRYLWENAQHTQRAADRTALKRLGTTEDVARAALFLSSEDSAFTTGTEITVDGGFSWR